MPLFRDSSPFVRQSLASSLSPGKDYDLRSTLRTFDSRLFYVTSGVGEMVIFGEAFPLSPGTAVLIRAGVPYVWRVSSMDFYSVNFDFTGEYSSVTQTFHPIHESVFPEGKLLECGDLDDEPLLNSHLVVHRAEAISDLLRRMTTEYHIGGAYCREFLSASIKSVIYTLLRLSVESEASRDTSISSDSVRMIVEYIEHHISENLSNVEIASKFHFNPSYLGRVFKRCTGTAMHEFILSLRLNLAAEALRSTDRPVSDISSSFGFSTPQHFSKSFKERFGISPRGYREGR